MSKAHAIGNSMKGFRTLVMGLALGALVLAGTALPAQAQARAGWGADNCYYVPGAFGWDVMGCRFYLGNARQGILYYLDAINATFYALPTTGDPNRYASLSPRELRSRGQVVNLMPQGGYGVPSTGGSRRECAGSHCWSDKDWVDSWVKSFKNPYQD